MRILYTGIFIAFLMISCDQRHPVTVATQETKLPNDLTAEEQSLLDDVRQMFRENDISPMMERVHKEGIEDWWLDMERDYLKGILNGGLGELELVRINPPRKEEKLMDGSVAEWSLPLKWELIVHQPSGDSKMNVSHTISLSEHESRIVSIRQTSKGGAGNPAKPGA